MIEMMKTMVTKKGGFSITPKDKQMLESFKPVAEGIARFFGKNCEVLLHSFESLDSSVIYIVNGHITGRQIGSPITSLGMKILKEAEKRTHIGDEATGCYYSKTTDGKTLKSATILIRGGSKKPIGMMCINFNMSAPLLDILNSFGDAATAGPHENMENFVSSVDELVKTTLQETIVNINARNGIPNHIKNKTIVSELIGKGIFHIRGSIDIVAKELHVSRYTIYNYLREHKFSINKERSHYDR